MDFSAQRKREIDQWTDIEELLRMQRHDFMNIFQTVSGYIQLQQPEKALEQIKQITHNGKQIGQLFRLACLPLAISIIDILKLNTIEENNIIFEVQNFIMKENYLNIHIEPTIKQVNQLLEGIVRLYDESKLQNPIQVEIEEHESCWIFFLKVNEALERSNLEQLLTSLKFKYTAKDDMLIVYFKLKKIIEK